VDPSILLAVPNVSEGRNRAAIAAIASAFEAAGAVPAAPHDAGAIRSSPVGTRLLDVHTDADHHRSVFTISGHVCGLPDALVAGGRSAVEHVDVMARLRAEEGEAGQHPHVGTLDVVPIVYLDTDARGAACATALVIADRLGAELEVPVFLYGELSAGDGAGGRTRAELRRGGIAVLAQRIAAGSEEPLRPDFGPPRMHPTAGATLVSARPPLVAFNLQLAAPAKLADARRIAGLIREGGAEGLPGLRAIGVELDGGVAQVSMNVEQPLDVSLASVAEAVSRHAPVASAELVGLAPRAALEGFPEDLPMPGFDPARHLIENAIGW
jgi:glutamate formiminotransferase/glutamate formiminotransferase/formiminotetrahydrofolate cyclodeaminase